MPLTLPTALTPTQFAEVVRLTRGYSYWPRRILGDAHGYAFVFAALYCIGAAILFPAQFNTLIAWLGIVTCGAIGWLLLRITSNIRKSNVSNRLLQLNYDAGSATFSDSGVEIVTGSGTHARLPWSHYSRAKVGTQIALLYLSAKGGKYHIFPIASPEAGDRRELLAILRVNLGPGKTKEASIWGSRLRPSVIRAP